MTSSPRDPARLGPAGQARGKTNGTTRPALGRPPVMADVAELAGVSHQTVSRVLNDHPNVRPHTREKVLAAIRQLAYRPNAAARSLVTRRTHILGVISIDSTLYGPAMMLHGIERAAQHGYFVVIASLPALDRRSMLDAIDRFLGQGVEGIIVIAPQTTAVAALPHVPASVPVIAVGCGTRAPVTSVAVDNAEGAARATRYLLELGHKTVHHVAGPSSWLDARERVDGWRDTLRAAGAPEPDVISGDWSARSGYEIGQRLAATSDVTAVLCANDNMALGLVRAMTEHGRRVPADVSVVGFDDVPESGYFLPPLTTVHQDFIELGRQALSALVDRLSGRGDAGSRVRIAPELVVRASAAPPPAPPPPPGPPPSPGATSPPGAPLRPAAAPPPAAAPRPSATHLPGTAPLTAAPPPPDAASAGQSDP